MTIVPMAILDAIGFLAFFGLLLRLSIDDVRDGMLYDRFVLPLALSGVLMVLAGRLSTPFSALMGSLTGGGLLVLVRLLSRGGMGGGDVKLAAALGIWTGLDGIFPALFIAFLLGSLWGIGWFLVSRGKRTKLPFGPFLAMGGMVGVFFGQTLSELYEAWFW